MHQFFFTWRGGGETHTCHRGTVMAEVGIVCRGENIQFIAPMRKFQLFFFF